MAWSPESQVLAVGRKHNLIEFWDAAGGMLKGSLVITGPFQALALSPEGHYRDTKVIEQLFVYVVETDHGQDMLTPAEFTHKYGWKNDPERVCLER